MNLFTGSTDQPDWVKNWELRWAIKKFRNFADAENERSAVIRVWQKIELNSFANTFDWHCRVSRKSWNCWRWHETFTGRTIARNTTFANSKYFIEIGTFSYNSIKELTLNILVTKVWIWMRKLAHSKTAQITNRLGIVAISKPEKNYKNDQSRSHFSNIH